MRNYGTINCPDCGIKVNKLSPNTKRCRPCAFIAHGETKHGFKDKLCIKCNCAFKPTSPTQKVCDVCRPDYNKEQNIKHLYKMRRSFGCVEIGATLLCIMCGCEFIYKSGTQKRCASCQKTVKNSASISWLNSDKDRLNKFKEAAKDNYFFGGNKKKAMARDGWACQHCGSKKDIHVHHIDGNGAGVCKEDKNNDLSNLLTLCRSCHTKEHHRMRHSSCAPKA